MDSDSDSGEVYAQCVKGHLVGSGHYANDGCLEYVQSLQCAVCGCHRNFHRLQVPAHGGDEATAAIPAGERRPLRQTRTRFNRQQREMMAAYAEQLGWHFPRRAGDQTGLDNIDLFCAEVGVTRDAFKRWMINNRKAFLASSSMSPPPPPPPPPPGGVGGSSVSHA